MHTQADCEGHHPAGKEAGTEPLHEVGQEMILKQDSEEILSSYINVVMSHIDVN